MKIRDLAPIAIVCLASWAPRIMTSGDAFGGAIGAIGKLPVCTHKHKPHQCSGPTSCGSLPTTEASSNDAETLYLPGDPDKNTQNCSVLGENCNGGAIKGDTGCHPPHR